MTRELDRFAEFMSPDQPERFWSTVWADMGAYCRLKPHRRFPSFIAVVDVLLEPGFMAVTLFRIGHQFHKWHLGVLARLCHIANVVLFSFDVRPAATVGPGFVVPHPNGVQLFARLGRDVVLYSHVLIGAGGYEEGREGLPIIGDRVSVYAGAKIFGPVTIGNDAVIATGALVLKSVPAGAVAMGIPAKVTRYRDGYGEPAAAPAVVSSAL